MLTKEKLNVVLKNRSNIFTWRGQFTPQFVEYLLDVFAKKDDIILDPFAGSGTVLAEASRLNLETYGCEINPAAYTMSKFFSFANYSIEKRNKLINDVIILIKNVLPPYKNLPVFQNRKTSFRDDYFYLLDYSEELLSQMLTKDQRNIILNLLFLIEKCKRLNIYEATFQSIHRIKNALLGLPYAKNKIDAFLCDAKESFNRLPQQASLIITSPPYINVFNYHQNFRSLMEILDFNLLKVAESEFGSNRKNRGNRFKTVIQYCMDIEITLYSLLDAIKDNSTVIMVVGRESKVRRVPFYNGKIVHQIVESIPSYSIIKNSEREFSNKFGDKIIEDILIFKKNNSENTPIKYIGRNIAKHHLEKSLNLAEPKVKQDIYDAIDYIDLVNPSPIFKLKDSLNNGKKTTLRQASSCN